MEKRKSDISNINHMDLANQIDNSWERDTVLSIVNEKKKISYSIRFKNRDKLLIKKKFINLNEATSAKRHNKKVINLIFGFMIYKVLDEIKFEIDR